jgi:3-deoxy-D-manno-octulosonate 8-phosphate phosphatase (KDO 8-P phosphatase)
MSTALAPRHIPAGWKPKTLVLDVDGVLTTGHFIYTVEGKAAKVFGPDDHDALLLLKPYMDVIAITGDRRGFDITKKRVSEDMNLRLELVSTVQRGGWLRENLDVAHTIYMGDGIFDALVFPVVGYAIAPANGAPGTKARADFVTASSGGDRAVAEACLHILERFFEPFDPSHPPKKFAGSGQWTI